MPDLPDREGHGQDRSCDAQQPGARPPAQRRGDGRPPGRRAAGRLEIAAGTSCRLELVEGDACASRARCRVLLEERGEKAPDRRRDAIAPRARHAALARQHLSQQGTERVEIGARILRLAATLLGRHVCRRPAGGGGAAEEERHAEVEHLHVALGGQEHVRRLQVAMHDAVRVRVPERAGHLGCDRDDLAGRDRTAREPALERLAVKDLVDEIREPAVDDAGVVQGRDVRVGEQRCGLALARGPRVRCRRAVERLQGDEPVQRGVVRLVDGPEPAAADRADDLVAAQPCARHQQRRRDLGRRVRELRDERGHRPRHDDRVSPEAELRTAIIPKPQPSPLLREGECALTGPIRGCNLPGPRVAARLSLQPGGRSIARPSCHPRRPIPTP